MPAAPDPGGAHSLSGLDPAEAAARLIEFGPNELPAHPPAGIASRLVRQIVEPMSLLLLGAAAVTGFGIGKRVDALAILSIVVANVVIALVQEGKAARALEALRSMETPVATVRRGGRPMRVPSRDVVPGDVVVLAAGDRVPADLRLLAVAGLEVDESLLTGESLPVGKDPAAAPGGTGLGDQRALVFAGTLIVRGSGNGLVVGTGAATQLGVIAARLEEHEPPTPLQIELRAMTGRLGAIAVVIAVAVFGLTLLRTGVTRGGLQASFLSAAALAVAAVPEGLPTVVTVALALGVRRMASRGAIVRRLPAVETLGSTTVVLTDKTGTLTENRMRVGAVAVRDGEPGDLASLPPALRIWVERVATLCNDASLDPPTGDPTEIALLEAFAPMRDASPPRLGEIPFDSARKRMTVVHALDGEVVVLTKGAPEVVLERCALWMDATGAPAPLTETDRRAMRATADEMATRGARVLALARKTLPAVPARVDDEERDMTLIGLIGLRDPVRPEAALAVARARAAGIQILMVTGDHAGTALAVATEVGLAAPGAAALTGTELRGAGLPDDPLAVSVYARVDPDEKLALTEALQARGHVVAVTGDGVNDAPALRRADIGVAMGRAGSDVAREAADMVVTDDNLATIITAVREGRGIYDNVRKVVDYLVAGNLSEIMVVVGALLLFPDLGVPLLPLQLLWINLLTDGFPALALSVDPVDPALMDRPPRPRAHRLLGRDRMAVLFARAVLIAGVSLGSLALERFAWHEPWAHARAVMFTVLVTAHLLYAFVARRSGPSRGTGEPNRWLVGAVVGGLALQILVVVVSGLHELFGTAGLLPREWAIVFAGGLAPVGVMMAARGTALRQMFFGAR